MRSSPGILFWRRPIDSHVPTCSPATLAGLTIYSPASQHVVFSARLGDAKSKNPDDKTHRGFCSGDVLLSHGLSPYYHRGCSVSLPCSEWERVVPLRYCHQSAEPHWRFAAVAATQARSRISGDFGRFRSIALPKFRKNTIFNRHSQVANRKSFLIRWHLHTGFWKQIR